MLRRVELQVARRLDGLLQGERRGRRPGPGGEATLTRPYQAGDDVRWVDWPLTARSTETMVRVPELEPVLTAWALLDRSPSMDFGTRAQAVSTGSSSGTRTITSGERAVSGQSTQRTSSPGWYGRVSAGSPPGPGRRPRRSP